MTGLKRSTQPDGTCKVLAKGDKRRLADGRNAFLKMDADQLEAFVAWMLENGLREVAAYQVAVIAAKLSEEKVAS